MNDMRDKIRDILEQVFNGEMSVKEAADLLMELTQSDERVYLITYVDRYTPFSRMNTGIRAKSKDKALSEFWSSRSRDAFEIQHIRQL